MVQAAFSSRELGTFSLQPPLFSGGLMGSLSLDDLHIASRKIKSPLTVELEVTFHCNNRCIFCYNSIPRQSGAGTIGEVDQAAPFRELRTDRLMKILDKLKQLDVGTITFTGGEPLIRRDLLKIIEYAYMLDFPSLVLVTNGCLITSENAKQLSQTLGFIQVSLHSANPDMHDFLVGRSGAFKETVRAIELLVAEGGKVVINVTATRLNFDGMIDLGELGTKLGVRGFSLTRFIPTGTGFKNMSELELLREGDISKFISNLLLTKEKLGKNFGASIPTPIPLCAVKNKEELEKLKRVYDLYKVSRCTAGLTWCVISPIGEIRPCTAMDTVVGNLSNDDLENIWCNSPVFLKLRRMEYLPKECRVCDHFNLCLGGCRAAALAYTGKLEGHDPWSKHFRGNYYEAQFQK